MTMQPARHRYEVWVFQRATHQACRPANATADSLLRLTQRVLECVEVGEEGLEPPMIPRCKQVL